MRTRVAAVLSLGAVMALSLLFILAQDVAAKNQPEFLPAFEATYPAAVGSRIDSCTICHNVQGSEYKLNSYARQWKEDENFVAINNFDADGDGYTNVEEINAHTFPGNASDNPSTVTTTTTVPGATTTTAAPGSGSAIYQANCASCHGGSGGNLVPTTLSLSQIVNVVNNGVGSMPGYSGSLTSTEIQLVSEYLFNWASTPTTTTTTSPGTPPPPPPNGSALYGTSCAGCHGANGGDLVGTPLTRSQLVDITTNGTSAGMPGYASTYNATEIDAIAGYILSLVAAPTTTTTTLPGTPPPPPPSGAAVYSSHCAACHGASGGDLVGRDLSTSRIASVTNSGTTGMPGFSTRLTQAETDAVVTYVAGRTGGTATTTTTVPGSPPPSGAAVFAESCAACHGPSGGDLVDHSLTDFELTSVISRGVGSMPGYASRLSSDQLAAVVAYLSSLGANASDATSAGDETGGIDAAALYTRYCSTCHGAHGQGSRNGPVAGTSLSRDELIAVTTDGLGSMPGYSGRMTAEEIEAVAEFVLALGSSNDEAVVVPSVSPGTSTGRLYTQLCATCHGDDGKGRGTVAPFGENLDAASVAAMIVNGGSRMPDYPDLSEASLNALVAHTLLLANGEPPADVAADGDSEAVAAAALGTNDPTPSPIHDVQTADGSGLPTTALVVVALGLLGLAGGVVYTRMRASRAVAQ
ncbi:MAG: c-type cytochrome [Acidimicrobiia bacterium]